MRVKELYKIEVIKNNMYFENLKNMDKHLHRLECELGYLRKEKQVMEIFFMNHINKIRTITRNRKIKNIIRNIDEARKQSGDINR